MSLRRLLACALLFAFSPNADAAGRTPGTWYTYLVTPSGHMYRLISQGRVVVATDDRITMMVTYAADSPEVDTVVRESSEIAAALGPDLEAKGHSGLAVQAKFGWEPRKTVATSVTYGVVFLLQDGLWVRRPPKKEDREKVEGAEAYARSPEDPVFPFDRAAVDAAGEAAASWIRLLDEGREDAVLASMTEAFRSQTESSSITWQKLIAQRRSVCATGERLELCRMQVRPPEEAPPAGSAVVVQYEFRPATGNRFIEEVTLLKEKGAWRPAGYRLRDLPRAK